MKLDTIYDTYIGIMQETKRQLSLNSQAHDHSWYHHHTEDWAIKLLYLQKYYQTQLWVQQQKYLQHIIKQLHTIWHIEYGMLHWKVSLSTELSWDGIP